MPRKPRPKPSDDSLSANQKRSILRYVPDDGPCVVREGDNTFAVYYVAVVRLGEMTRPDGAYVYRTADGRWFNEAWQAAQHLADGVEVKVRSLVDMPPATPPKTTPVRVAKGRTPSKS